jgi:hypothetical protein
VIVSVRNTLNSLEIQASQIHTEAWRGPNRIRSNSFNHLNPLNQILKQENDKKPRRETSNQARTHNKLKRILS